MSLYQNRQDAGKQLTKLLVEYAENKHTIVLALPRGGVPVAYEISRELKLPLDIFIIRKLGMPGYSEFAIGAITSLNTSFLNYDIIKEYNISENQIHIIKQKEEKELRRRELAYRGNKLLPDVKNKTIILVDDGIATGATMQAAILALQQLQPSRIICAVPVSSKEGAELLSPLVSKFICPLIPKKFIAVGYWYQDFEQTSDEEVKAFLLP